MRLHLLIFSAMLIAKQSATVEIPDVLKVSNNAASKNALDDKLNNMIEGFREIMKNGNESLGIPRLDPLQLDSKTISLNTTDLKGNFFASSLNIKGLSDYKVNIATFKLVGLKLKISLEWPKVEGTVLNYIITNGRFMNYINLLGSGNASFSIKTVKFSIDTSIASDEKTKFLYIKSLNTSTSIGEERDSDIVQFYTEGLYNDREISELFSGIISELVPTAFNTYYVDMTKTLNKFLTDAANEFLYGKTLKDLLALSKPKSVVY